VVILETMRTWQYLVLILGIFIVPVFLLAASPDDNAIITTVITTVAGGGQMGFAGNGGAAISAELGYTGNIAIDSSGNLYIVDSGNDRVRKVSTSGIITTAAGNGYFSFDDDNIPATSAKLATPIAVAIDISGNLYFTDHGSHRIRNVH
jgi:hypothetical protein